MQHSGPMSEDFNQVPEKEPEQTPVLAPWVQNSSSNWLVWVALVLGVAVIVLVIMGAGTLRVAVVAVALVLGLFRVYYGYGRK